MSDSCLPLVAGLGISRLYQMGFKSVLDYSSPLFLPFLVLDPAGAHGWPGKQLTFRPLWRLQKRRTKGRSGQRMKSTSGEQACDSKVKNSFFHSLIVQR